MRSLRKTSGGESFDIQVCMSSSRTATRIAMNRPPRLSSAATEQSKAAPAVMKKDDATDTGRSPASAAVPRTRPSRRANSSSAASTKSGAAQNKPSDLVPSNGGDTLETARCETPSGTHPPIAAPLYTSAALRSQNTTPTSPPSDGATPIVPYPPSSALAALAAPTSPSSSPVAGEWVYQPPPDNQRTFHFPEDGLHFTSAFETGNLIQVERVAANRYQLYSCPDCGNSPVQTNNRQWFHFAVRGATKGTVLQLQFVGLMNSKTYSFGWTPVAAVCPSRPVYSRISSRVVIQKLDAAPPTPGYPLLSGAPKPEKGAANGEDDAEGGDEGESKSASAALNVSFEYRFDCDVPVDPQLPFGHPMCPCVFIASNHPYGLMRLQKSIAQWKAMAESPSAPPPPSTHTPASSMDPHISTAKRAYLRHEVLTYSLDGRPIDLLTITAPPSPSSTAPLPQESPFGEDPAFPLPVSSCPGARLDQPIVTERPMMFPERKYVLLTARVHPGETPASHILHGCIDFLLDAKDPRSRTLLHNYVFVVVPILNPDGVARGHSRADTTGQNLNRMYRSPCPKKHPSIYAVRQLMLQLQRTHRLALYVDMHAHANKKGAFFFGNAMSAVDQIQNLLFAKLVSLNTPHLEFASCNFSESNMFAMGKNGETKDGSSRVAIFQETGFIHSYTIETSYVTGTVQNAIAPNPTIPGEEIDILPGTPSPKYNQATFADVGKGILVSLLDMHNINPNSRLPHGPHRNLRGVVQWIQRQLVYEVFEWYRKQLALRAGIPTVTGASSNNISTGGAAGPLATSAAVSPSTASATMLGGVNLDSLSPATLPLSSLASVADQMPDVITVRGSKTFPPTTIFQVHELVAEMQRDRLGQSASTAASSLASPPASTASSAPPTLASKAKSTVALGTRSAIQQPSQIPSPSIRRVSTSVTLLTKRK